jgi:hypothetical protein
MYIRRIITHPLRNPKINQLELSLNHQKIRRLQIRMHNLLLMNRLHSTQHLLPIHPHKIQTQRRTLMLRQDMRKINLPAFHQLPTRQQALFILEGGTDHK